MGEQKDNLPVPKRPVNRGKNNHSDNYFTPLSIDQWKTVIDIGDLIPDYDPKELIKDKQKLRNTSLDSLLGTLEKSLAIADPETELKSYEAAVCIIGEEIVARPDYFIGESATDILVDKNIKKYLAIAQQYSDKLRSVGNNFNIDLNNWALERRIIQKRDLANLLGPGNYFGHGSYTSQFEDIVTNNGLMSAKASEVNGVVRGNSRFETDGTNIHSDVFGIFFSNWNAVESPSGYYARPGNDLEKQTNISFFYQAGSLLRHASFIRSQFAHKESEIAVTNYKDILKWPISNDTTGNTFLPLEEAYIIVQPRHADMIRKKLETRFNKEWIEEHIYVTKDDTPWTNYYALKNEHEQIHLWLEEKVKTESYEVRLETIDEDANRFLYKPYIVSS